MLSHEEFEKVALVVKSHFGELTKVSAEVYTLIRAPYLQSYQKDLFLFTIGLLSALLATDQIIIKRKEE